MDLWIRSQDREIICKAECIDLMHDTEGYAKVFLNGNFPDLIVAVYENKRALEVLDEIQNLLQPRIIVNKELDAEQENALCYFLSSKNVGKVMPRSIVDMKCIPLDTIVYEMPEK